jgi:flagellar export protein FliJ
VTWRVNVQSPAPMPNYRLQTLLEIRARAKEDAEQAFAAAMAALNKEKEALKKLEEDLARRKVERKAKVAAYLQEVMAKGGTQAGGFTSLNRFEDRLKDEEAQVGLDIERQKEVVIDAEKTVEEKRKAMADAAMELKAIEKHKDKWKLQVRTERQTREEMTQEEIGNALFLQRQKK